MVQTIDEALRQLRELTDDQARLVERQRRLTDAIERQQAVSAAEWLSLSGIKRYCGKGRAAIKAAERAERLQVHRGDHGEILVRRAELDRWLSSRPYQPQPETTEPDDPDAEAEAQLQALVRRSV